MRKLLLISLSLVFIAGLFWVAWANDGTIEGAVPGSNEGPGTGVQVTDDTYVITPFESVSINQTTTWTDNRHRAYWSASLLNVNGFLLFDVTAIPDGSTITSMTLRCYLENAYGSPSNNPVVDIYYSEDDGWTRLSATPGSLSLDVLLQNDVPFSSWIYSYDFVLDVAAHDWTQDLIDNQICIGFKNDVNYYSYVYFFGAYGSPTGPAPELTIEADTSAATPVVLTAFNADVREDGVLLTWNTASELDCYGWVVQRDGIDVSEVIPGYGTTEEPHDYSFMDQSVEFGETYSYRLKQIDLGGAVTYFNPITVTVSAAEVIAYELLQNRPNPFNPLTTIGFALPEAERVNLSVYNLSGGLVATLVDGYREAGAHDITFDAAGLSSGVYFYKLTAGDYSSMHKMVLMK